MRPYLPTEWAPELNPAFSHGCASAALAVR
jgi:hypothetical protein